MEEGGRTAAMGGWAGRMLEAARWWRERRERERSRAEKRQMFLVETIFVGPRQRVVLLRCGTEQFLVGTGPEGIQSITRVGAEAIPGDLPVLSAGAAGWS